VEEAVRFESPIQMIARRSARDVEVSGTSIPKNSLVMLVLGAANRDERHFEDPDTFDPSRTNLLTHLGFGIGNHICLGAPLARLEGRIAMEGLVQELAAFKQRDGDRRYHDSMHLRGQPSLPIARSR